MMRKTLWGVLTVVALIALAIELWSLRPGADKAAQLATPMQIVADCDSAKQACAARGEDLEFELRLGPPVRPMEAFGIQLRGLRGALDADAQITVEFQMRDMDMGLNRYRLEPAADGAWQGRAILPVCTTGRSDWIARVEIVQRGRRWTAELPFSVAQQ